MDMWQHDLLIAEDLAEQLCQRRKTADAHYRLANKIGTSVRTN